MIVIAQPSSASVGGSVGEPAGDEPLAAALSLLRSRCSVDLATPENPGELDGVLHRSGGRRIVVAGGDASMHAVVDALNRRNELADAVLALLPLDADCHFARSRQIPSDPVEAAALVLDGQVRRVAMLIDDRGEVVVDRVRIGSGPRMSRLRLHVEVDHHVVADFDQQVLGVTLAPTPAGPVEATVHDASGLLPRLGYVVAGALRASGIPGARRHARRGSDRGNVRLTGDEVAVHGVDFWARADGELEGPERHRTWRAVASAYSLVLP